jgi:signal transduction histidine kinase
MRTQAYAALDALTEVYERERTAAADALHDGPLQRLAAASLRLQSAAHHGELSAQVAAQAVADVDAAAAELRAVMTGLMSWHVTADTLADAVGDYVLRACRGSGIRCPVSIEPGWELSPRHGAAVFRLVQGAVGNAVRHASSREIEVRVERRDLDLLVWVRDDGVGFDVPLVDWDGETGLGLMRRRIEAVGGSLEIDSAPGHGTTVSATLPNVFS